MLTLTGRRNWYRYIHMDGRRGARSAFARGLKDGSHVKAGQIVAYVGNTGDAAGGPCHLHFELHRGNSVSSPYTYLDKARILQLDPTNPLSSNAVTPRVSLTIRGVVAWAATLGGEGRLVIRPTGVSASDGTHLSRAGTISLRANPTLITPGLVGRSVVITTVACQLTTALQDIVPLTWTAATIT
jgi:hypothetical protein